MKLLYRHCKLTTESNRHSQGSGPLWSGPIGPGSGYSGMPPLSANEVTQTKPELLANDVWRFSISIMIKQVHEKI